MIAKSRFVNSVITTMLISMTWAFAGNYDVSWSTVDGGGQMSATGRGYLLSGTIGQADAGSTLSGGEYTMIGGFWAVSAALSLCGSDPGDMDGDDDVDLVDFGEFQLCYTGPSGAISEDCECADFDSDNDVDLVDFGAFQLAFTGPTF